MRLPLVDRRERQPYAEAIEREYFELLETHFMTDPRHFEDVHQAELAELELRREQAGIAADSSDDAEDGPRNRTGLSLSGGGIRSAAFNLGLLQALNQQHLLPQVDYLSTVSGGGYIGSHLSSLATSDHLAEHRARRVTTGDGSPRLAHSMVSEEESGRQPESVRRLIRGGKYLNRPFSFFSRYAIGVIAINLPIFSFLVLICAIATLGFRCLDLSPVMTFLWACGFSGDVLRAFAPALVLMLLWIVTWICAYMISLARRRRVDGRISTFFFGATVICTLLAIAALLGTGDISFTSLQVHFDITPDTNRVGSIQHSLVIAAGMILVLALLPYLRPEKLIRSATNPKNAFESVVFKVASNALLLGIPLAVFGIFAKENISLRNDSRPDRYHVVRTSLRWNEFWSEVENERLISLDDNPSRWFHKDVGNEGYLAAKQHRAINKMDRESTLFTRILSFPERLEARKKYDELRDRVAAKIDRNLVGKREFYMAFQEAESFWGTRKQDELDRAIGIAESAADDNSLAEVGLKASIAEVRPLLVAFLKQTALPDVRARLLSKAVEFEEHMDAFRSTQQRLRQANWELTRTYYGKDKVRSLDTIFAFNVTRFGPNGDQGWRLGVIWVSLSVFLLSGCLVNLNVTSIHGFYRDQLAGMWLAKNSSSRRNRKPTPLHELRNCEFGLPYQLINCTLNFVGHGAKREPTSVFLLSKRYCGSDSSDYQTTDSYMNGTMDLENAMAISGAAVSPTVFSNWFLVAFLLIANMRLGQWLHNPGKHPRFPRILDLPMRLPPAVIPIGIEYMVCRRQFRQYCFVTDGGHHENLGVESLLKRRCRVIICSDAGADPDTSFHDLTKLIRRMRVHEGIRFTGLDGEDSRVVLDRLIPKTGMAQTHFIVLKIHYPSGNGETSSHETLSVNEGYLIYVKSSITGDEDIDLLRHKSMHPNFPHDATIDQFYDEQRFESYRQLGHHIGEKLCEELFPGAKSNNSKPWLADWKPSGDKSVAAPPKGVSGKH